MESFYDHRGNFSGHKFVRYLDSVGQECIYNGSTEDFEKRPILPNYYDETKIKRAQAFFEENITSMMIVSTAGLIVLLSDPRGIKLLVATNKSSEPHTAYKRYKDTTLHMISWYRGEFKPGSKLWKSVLTVRHMHNAAVKLGQKQGFNGIHQFGLSGTLYGFFGFALARQKEFGLSSATDEDLEALVHFWRIIGYVMGVDERFNLCRESLSETRAICEALTDELGKCFLQPNAGSLKLQFAALDGAYMANSAIKSTTFMNFVQGLLTKNEHFDYLYPMSWKEELDLKILTKMLELCRYQFLRKLSNLKTHYMVYLMEMYSEIIDHSFREKNALPFI